MNSLWWFTDSVRSLFGFSHSVDRGLDPKYQTSVRPYTPPKSPRYTQPQRWRTKYIVSYQVHSRESRQKAYLAGSYVNPYLNHFWPCWSQHVNSYSVWKCHWKERESPGGDATPGWLWRYRATESRRPYAKDKRTSSMRTGSLPEEDPA